MHSSNSAVDIPLYMYTHNVEIIMYELMENMHPGTNY